MEIINDVNGLFEFQDLGARTELKNKANLVQSKNLFDMTSYLNFLNTMATRPIANGALDNIDSSSFTFSTIGHDCYTNGWAASSNTVFKIQVQQNTTYTMSWDFSGSDGSTFVFFNGVSGSGNMVQTKNSKMKLTFTTKEDTTFITVRFGIDDGGTSATIGKIQVEEGTESTTYLPSMVSEGVNEVDKVVADNVESIKVNTIDIANNSALINQNLIKAITDKANNVTINDSSNNNIVGLTMYGKSTQNTIPTPTNPVDINDINNPSITFSNDSDNQSINIQCTLRGIENVYDTLTVNSDGTGYITQRLFVERITSQAKPTSFEWKYSNTTHRFFRNDYSYSFDVKDNKPLILCSHLDVGENERNTTFDNSIGWINVQGVGIAIRMTEFNGDVSAFKKWLDDNEMYVVAPRSKPITVNLSKEQVDKILSLHTYYPSTKISADTNFEVTYIADTKNYIDNKILEVATALVAHEGEVN